MNTTAVTLDSYSENFIKSKIAEGHYHSVSEVVCAGLRLLEEKEKISILKSAIDKGINSGFVSDFDSLKFLASLKAARSNG